MPDDKDKKGVDQDDPNKDKKPGQGPDDDDQKDPPKDQKDKDDDSQSDDDDFDKKRALDTIKKLRGIEKQSKETEKLLADARAELKKIEDAKLSDQDKLTKRVAELETELADANKKLEVATEEHRVFTVKAAIMAQAAKQNAVDPEAVAALVDWADIEYDDDGPTNIEAVVKELLKAKPYLLADQTMTKGGGTPPRQRQQQQQQQQRQSEPAKPTIRL